MNKYRSRVKTLQIGYLIDKNIGKTNIAALSPTAENPAKINKRQCRKKKKARESQDGRVP